MNRNTPSNNILDYYDNNSDSSDFTNSSFRVSVCLKRYFRDIRALCFVLVTRKRTVKWLERKIQKIFHLQDRFYLTTNGHLLPSSERLGLLNPDDIVEVIPNEISSNIKQHGDLNCLSNNDYGLGENVPDAGPKQKPKSSSELTLNNIKNGDVQLNGYIYKCQEEHNEEENFIRNDYVLNESLPSNVSKENDALQQEKQNALAFLDSTYGISAEVTQTGDETIVIPRKRKRVRRRRQMVESAPICQEISMKSSAAIHKSLNNVTEDSLNTYSADYERGTCISTESSITNSNCVTHNEIAAVRKPRIVRSLIEPS